MSSGRDANARPPATPSSPRWDAQLTALGRSAAGPSNALTVFDQAVADRLLAAQIRERSALARAAAAQDRTAARRDRVRAAEDRRAAEAELAREGVDHLTRALRRNGGLHALQRELDRSRRTGEALTVAFIDIDHLKSVNDQQGHLQGDALLSGVVASITRVLRPYDVILRFGGDEFVCVLCGQTGRPGSPFRRGLA